MLSRVEQQKEVHLTPYVSSPERERVPISQNPRTRWTGSAKFRKQFRASEGTGEELLKRERFYTPESIEALAALGPTQKDYDLIDRQVVRLAAKPELGFRIPVQLFAFPGGLFLYEVGPYKLYYNFTDTELRVISVSA